MRVLKPSNHQNAGHSAASRKQKRERTVLSISQKKEIAQRVENGEDRQAIAKAIGISLRSVRRIVQNAPLLNQFSTECFAKNRKHMKEPKMKDLNARLYSWFLEKRAQGDPMMGMLLQEQAKIFNAEMGGPANFRASEGWLEKFKKYYGIRQVSFQGERLSADEDAATVYVGELMEQLEQGPYDLEDVYNMDETGLCWKSLPNKTLAHFGEKRVDGGKLMKDRITIGVCSNAAGTHRLPLIVIGKYRNPRCFSNYTEKPVFYRWQKKAWVTGAVFSDWFKNCFQPIVKLRQLRQGRSGKVLLLVDNCAAHKLDESVKVDERFRIQFLPPNTTSILQPMDQGVIVKMKRRFQGKLLRKLLSFPGGVKEFYVKNYILRSCIEMVAAAWSELTEENLKNAWRKLLPTMVNSILPGSDSGADDNTQDIVDLIKLITGDISDDEVYAWLHSKQEKEIEVAGLEAEDGSDEEQGLEDELELDPDYDSSGDDDEESLRLAFEKILKWSRKQPETIKNCQECVYSYFTQ